MGPGGGPWNSAQGWSGASAGQPSTRSDCVLCRHSMRPSQPGAALHAPIIRAQL